jgi:hypothetical protein
LARAGAPIDFFLAIPGIDECVARSPVLQVVAIGPESLPSLEDRLQDVEARLAALELSSRV